MSHITRGMGCLSPLELALRIKLGLKCISYHDFSVKAITVIVCPNVRPSCYIMLSMLWLAGVAGC